MRLNVSGFLRSGVMLLAAAWIVTQAAGVTPAASATVPAATTVLPPPAPVVAPTDPTDVQAWLLYRSANQLTALPAQATILFRMGNESRARGDNETAVRLWRGAEELDPGFLAPRVTLISYFFAHDPSQGLMEIGRLSGLARTNFRLQHFLFSYSLFYFLTGLFMATVGVALLLCWRHRNRLRHVYQELLTRRLPAPRARLWAWAALALPWLLGLGVAIPAAFTLSLLWSYLKRTERLVLAALVAMLVLSPMAVGLFEDLALPARDSGAPFHSTANLDQEAYRPERMAEIAGLAQAHPDNAFLAFAEGWMSQRGHRYDEALAAYERAQNLWPQEARIPNNLGNIEFLRGNGPQAEIHYKRAISLSPRWAAAHYNLGQLYTARFRYAEASEEIAQATALDFDLVRNLQARSSTESTPALAEEWLEPGVQWQAVFAHDHESGTSSSSMVPLQWKPWFESRGMAVAIWTLLLTALGIALGLVLHHHLPARTCGNCNATVCRRCATRRKDQVLCEDCAAVLLSATTPEFGRLLLFKRRRETKRRRGHIRTAIAIVVPGYGLIAFERVVFGWLLAVGSATALLLLVSGHAPFPYDPRVLAGAPRPMAGAVLVTLAVSYFVSLFAYLSLNGQAREEDAGIETTSSRTAPRLKRAA